MGAACKTPCQKSADGSDEAGLEPTTPVVEPDVSLASCAQTASETKVEDELEASKLPEADVKLQTFSEDAEMQSARQAADKSSPTPAEQGAQLAPEDGAAGKIEEAKEDTVAVAAQPAKDDVAAEDAATAGKQGEQATKDTAEEQGKTSAIDEGKPDVAAEPSEAIASEAVAKANEKPVKSTAKKAPRKVAKAAAKKKKEADNKKPAEAEVPKKNADKSGDSDEDFQRTKSKASLGRKDEERQQKSTKVEGWGSVEALQAMFGEDVDEDKEAAESADLAQEYFEAVKLVKHGKPKKGAPNNEEKLTLYGLFKQVNCGDNPKAKPGMLSGLEARGKWNAWNSRRGMDKKSAMEEYIKVVKAQKVKYQVVV